MIDFGNVYPGLVLKVCKVMDKGTYFAVEAGDPKAPAAKVMLFLDLDNVYKSGLKQHDGYRLKNAGRYEDRIFVELESGVIQLSASKNQETKYWEPKWKINDVVCHITDKDPENNTFIQPHGEETAPVEQKPAEPPASTTYNNLPF